MLNPRYLGQADLLLFVIPFTILVVMPSVILAVAYFTRRYLASSDIALYLLAITLAPWVMIPGFVFREPLFEPVELGYAARGLLGAFVIVAFWTVVSLTISLAIRYVLRRAGRRQHI
jgi:hypothetical protein